MPGTSSDHDGRAGPPASAPEDGPPSRTGTRERPGRKKVLAPLVLAVLGLALLVAAFVLYPRTPEPAAPASTTLDIIAPSNYAASAIAEIDYTVDQVRPDVARLTISLVLDIRAYRSVEAGLTVTPPAGTVFVGCPRSHPECGGTWGEKLSFKFPGVATAHVFVKARSFGVNSDGITAAAAIPAISFAGSKGANLIAAYRIPSASSYDWSADPPSRLSGSGAVWDETVTPGTIYSGGDTPGRVASGINHAAQANDDTRIFVAGALLGLAGGALLSAVQEALHASD
jgi:hypothetical protein